MKRLPQSLLLFSLVSFICFLGMPAVAQTQTKTPSQQKREVRESLRDAKSIESDYQESHLNVQAFNLRRGESGRKRVRSQDQENRLVNKDIKVSVKKKNKPKKRKAFKSWFKF